MSYTIFENPTLSSFFKKISLKILNFLGWEITGTLPKNTDNYVVIAYPHRTWKDLPFMIMASFALNLKVKWMAKKELFKFPFKKLLIFLGGIPIDRYSKNNTVNQCVKILKDKNKKNQLVISPEGTRKGVKEWKTGFYHIAYLSSSQIALAYIDYKNKKAGIFKMFTPTGDVKKDIEKIKRFYDYFLD